MSVIKLSELRATVGAMTPADEYKAEASWNNAGMPLADFTIPGHNEGATVEMLAVDAAGIVALRAAAPVLLAIAAAAMAWELNFGSESELVDNLIAALSKVSP